MPGPYRRHHHHDHCQPYYSKASNPSPGDASHHHQHHHPRHHHRDHCQPYYSKTSHHHQHHHICIKDNNLNREMQMKTSMVLRPVRRWLWGAAGGRVEGKVWEGVGWVGKRWMEARSGMVWWVGAGGWVTRLTTATPSASLHLAHTTQTAFPSSGLCRAPQTNKLPLMAPSRNSTARASFTAFSHECNERQVPHEPRRW